MVMTCRREEGAAWRDAEGDGVDDDEVESDVLAEEEAAGEVGHGAGGEAEDEKAHGEGAIIPSPPSPFTNGSACIKMCVGCAPGQSAGKRRVAHSVGGCGSVAPDADCREGEGC